MANLGVGSYLTLQSAVNLNFNFNTPASTVSIKVDQYGGEVDKIVLYVVAGANSNPATWKKIKTVPFTGAGTVLSVTSQEVATALGTTVPLLAPGTFYTFYNQVITKDGRTFDVTNTLGALESNSNYNAVLRWAAFITCPFVAPVAGNYRVVQDDWADWSTGDIVVVTDGPGANQVNLSLVWPGVPAGGIVKNPFIVNVAPATGTASIPKVDFGTYGGSTIYTAQNPAGAASAGYVFSCTGLITLRVLITAGASSFGVNALVLQKL